MADGAAGRSSPAGWGPRTRCTCSTCSGPIRTTPPSGAPWRPIHEAARWDYDPSFRFWDGEVEPCINGRTVAIGAYFGQDVKGIVDRLMTEQMDDGGWNCEQENGSTRGAFDSTLNVLEGLLEYERSTGANGDIAAARASWRGVPPRPAPPASAVGRRDPAEAVAVRRLPERVVLRRRARSRLHAAGAARSRRRAWRRRSTSSSRSATPPAAGRSTTPTTTRSSSTSASRRASRADGSRCAHSGRFAGPAAGVPAGASSSAA